MLYKVRPARVVGLGEKVEIELERGQTKRVRTKDIELLHPGPLRSLNELVPQEGELDEAWELLEGGETTLRDLTELAFDAFTPATAWAAWQRVTEGLCFDGTPDTIRARRRDEVERDRAEREARAVADLEWRAFLDRVAEARPGPEDAERLGEVERLAHGRIEHSRTLEALGHSSTPENAHRALVKMGYWGPRHNPHPARCGIAGADPELPVPDLADEERLDLTHLPAFAIDDEGNSDPDDALSLDGDRIWVHVADVAALVEPDSPLDREARSRGSNLYVPEGVVNMLPVAVTERLGLGLQTVSPALSFSMHCDADGTLRDIEIHRTWIRASRLSYETVERCLEEPPFAALQALTGRFRDRRVANGATSLDLPEVSVRLVDGRVVVRPLPRLASRSLVTDAMLMAGEAAARFCLEREIQVPFATQVPPEGSGEAMDLAAMYARRRSFKPTRLIGEPGPHAGLGLALYTRTTSPLRRYSDLLVHQQIRAWLSGRDAIEAGAVVERVAEAEMAAASIRRAERLSNQHWKLIYLREDSSWKGEAVVVAAEDRKSTVLVPELALEARVRTRGKPSLNDRLRVAVQDVDVADLAVSFRIL